MAGPPPPPGPPPPSLGSSKPPVAAMPIDRNALLSSIRQGASLKKTETDDRSAPKVGGGVVENGSAAKPSMSAPAVPKPSAPSGGMDLNSMLQNAFNAKKMHAAESSVSSDIRNEIKLPSAPAISSIVPGIPPPLPNSSPSAPPLPDSAPSAPPLPDSAPSAPPLPDSAPSAPPLPDSAPSAPPLPNSAPSAPPLPNAIPSIPPPLPSSTPGIPPPNVHSSAPVTRNTPPANPLAGGLPFLAEIQKKRDDSHVIDETKVPKTSETVSSNLKHEDRNTGIPAAPPLPSSIPKAPELPSGMTAAPPLPSNMPSAPPLPTSIPKAPELPSGMPSAPPLPTSIPKAPELPSSIPKAPELPSSIPKAPELPSSIPKAPELPSSIPKAPELPSSIPKAPELPSSIPKAPELPSSIPKAPGLPTGIPTPAANPLAGGLPFLAEIQRKRDDSHVVDEKDVAAVSKKGASSLTPHEPKLSTGMGNQRVPSIPPPLQHSAPSVPSMPPPVQHSAPSVPNMPPPVQHNAQSIPPPIQQTTIKTAPSHIPSSATSSSKKAPPPPPAVEPATTGNYKTRLFSDGTSTTETTSLREGRPNEQLTDSTSYLNKAGMKNKLSDIEIPENSRFKWLTKDEMPLPRPFTRKTKLYPSGRGSSVPLNLKIYD
ncbi:Vrp1 protein [Hanseniaspora uvarum]|nr:Vrp1 protein [Hanseniaspora uvarum]